MAKQVCTECGEPSLPGLIQGAGKCQYHWNVGAYGKDWADKVRADSETARNRPKPEGK